MNRKAKVILIFIASLWLVVPLYMVLHEGGHALAGISFGAKIVEVNLLNGYVISEGGHISNGTLSLFYSAGLLMPLIVFTIYLSFYPKETTKDLYRMVSLLFTIRILFSIAVWGIIPIQYMTGRVNRNDDVAQFIEASGIHPMVIVVIAISLMSIYMLFIWKKRIFQNAYDMLSIEE